MTRNRQPFFSILSLGLILWISRFLLAGKFGFYEDDYTLVVHGMDSTWHETWEFISNLLFHFGGQGRPLQHSLLFFISRMVGQLDGIRLGYLAAFAIVLLNCCLFYLLLRKLVHHEFALLAAIFYTLYSADTTQAFLFHAFGLQQSLTCFLLAGLAYVSKKRVLPYLLILGSLLSYENTYFVFLAMPLLVFPWDKALVRRMFGHTLVLVTIFALIAILRIALGETRAASLAWPEIVTTPLAHMIQGPIVAVGTAILRPLQSIRSIDPVIYAVSILAFALFYRRLWAILPGPRDHSVPQSGADPVEAGSGVPPRTLLREALLGEKWKFARLLLVAVFMLVLAYPLTFTIRAYALSGRDTRVHFAGIIGYALFWSSLWWSLITFWRSTSARRLLIGLLSINLALILGFGFILQKDYARAWTLQQTLWKSILANVPDLDAGMTIFIDPAGLEDARFIDANTWSMPRILPYIYIFPGNWEALPMVHRLLPDWEDRLQVNGQEIKAVDFSWTLVTSPWDKTVILTTENNKVSGRIETLEYEGVIYALKVISQESREPLACGYIYDWLIEPDNGSPQFCR
jgi:hypothetical protein